MHMAEGRNSSAKLERDDEKLLMWLGKDEFRRSLLTLPRDAQKSTLSKSSPEMSDEDLEKALDCMEVMRERDPLALLREDLLAGQHGQFQILSMAPNFELAMYLAQATGSVIVTHSNFRWRELKLARQNAAHLDGVAQILESDIGNFAHRLTADPNASFHQRLDGSFAHARTALRRFVLAARPVVGRIGDQNAQELVTELDIGFRKAAEEAHPSSELSFDSTIDWLLPRDGLVHNNVQRLLLMSGNDNHLDRVSMALRLVPQCRVGARLPVSGTRCTPTRYWPSQTYAPRNRARRGPPRKLKRKSVNLLVCNNVGLS